MAPVENSWLLINAEGSAGVLSVRRCPSWCRCGPARGDGALTAWKEAGLKHHILPPLYPIASSLMHSNIQKAVRICKLYRSLKKDLLTGDKEIICDSMITSTFRHGDTQSET